LPAMAETPPVGYANELRREIMRSEVQRVRMLAIVLAALLAATLIATNFFPEFTLRMFRGGITGWEPLAAIGPFFLYEVVVLFVLRRRAAQDKDFPRIGRFGNALVETSLPSVIIYELSHHMDMPTVLGYWPPMLYFVFILLSTLRLDFWLSVWTGAVAAVQLFALAAWLLPIEPFSTVPEHALTYNLSRSIVLLGSGIIAGIVAGSLRRQFETSVAAAAARDRVTNLFGQHVSPQVVDRLLAAGSTTSSDARQVAVMFVDIRGFTAAARARTPQEVVDRLDAAFAVLVEIVDRNGGIVNKFLGDGFLALFGAPLDDPDAPRRAVTAAREMLAAIEQHNVRSDWPLRIGIGLHFGQVVAGNVGSPRRKEYTVIGDTVNLASRIEGLNKQFGSQLLISDAVRQAIGEDGDATPLGDVPIRGYEQPIRVWRLA
jgi:adenylate cyclase